jgi:NADH-quinone oxidoreductase subunit M
MLLITLLFLPIAAGVLTIAVKDSDAKRAGILGTALTFLLSLVLLGGLTGAENVGLYQFRAEAAWLPVLGVKFAVGVDGPATLLVVLTTFLHLMAAFFAGDSIKHNQRAFYSLLLLLEGTVIGAFVALDTVLFYLFFEACLIPAYFLIGIWGGHRRVQAATKFFVYTVVGSLLMLASIIGLYLATGTFEAIDPASRLAYAAIPVGTQLLLFGGFAVAFAVKTGLFPFHTWLPDTYAEAPPVVTALLSGVLAKLGTYGFYRFCLQAFPDASERFAPFMVAIGVVSIIYGAFVAAAQTDARRVIAYSSISHLGFVVAGLFSLTHEGVSGAILQMVNHGITSGALFFLLGLILTRRGTTHLQVLGGLWEQMPRYSRFFLIITLSAVALPLTNGFVGEFLILLGTFQTFPVLAALATTGVIWSAVYMLRLCQRMLYGPVSRPQNRALRDLTPAEYRLLVPFVVLIFLLGIYPAPLQRGIDRAVRATLQNNGRTLQPTAPPTIAQATSQGER